VHDLDPIVDRLRTARTITAFTGAGISAASGIPTFRGEDGLWRKVRSETIATPEAFAHDPKLVWEWYDWRRQMILDVSPNAAHEVLARWTRQREGFSLVTQNVDGLLERAGADPVIRLHGSLWHMRCYRPCAAGRADWHDAVAPLAALPPPCPHCGGMARPSVTWFGEPLDRAALDAAARAAACDVFLAIGTSAQVYPAAGLVPLARRHGAFVVEINPDATAASTMADVAVRAPAEEVLRALADAMKSEV
jgi:NAD-dependent deacetylase